MTTQNTALPLTNPQDNIDQRVSEYFTTQFSPRGKFTDSDYELVKSFCVNRTSSADAAASLIAAILNATNELQLTVTSMLETNHHVIEVVGNMRLCGLLTIIQV